MSFHIEINGREINNPLAKFGILLSGLVVVTVLTAGILFLLLPIIGIAVSLSVGFVVVVLAVILAAIILMGIGAALSGSFRIFRRKRRHSQE